MKKQRIDVAKLVTDKIIAELEAGRTPWIKPWKCTDYSGMPYNGTTNKPYQGVNVLMCWLSGFSSPDWYTMRQLSTVAGSGPKWEPKHKGALGSRGCRVKPDQLKNGTPIVFYKLKDYRAKETEDDGTVSYKMKRFPLIRFSTAYNRDQIDGLPPLPKSETVVAPTPEDIEAILESLNLEAGVKFGGDVACYMPTPDGIRLPNVGDFDSEDHFKSTALHEAVHSTGHKSRLDRDLKNGPGSKGYAFEELVAEMGSAMCCAMLGIEWEKLQHADYIASWLEVLKNDSSFVIRAASKATKAAKFLLPEAEAVEEAKAA